MYNQTFAYKKMKYLRKTPGKNDERRRYTESHAERAPAFLPS